MGSKISDALDDVVTPETIGRISHAELSANQQEIPSNFPEWGFGALLFICGEFEG